MWLSVDVDDDWYVWWRIEYEDHADGWFARDYRDRDWGPCRRFTGEGGRAGEWLSAA